MEWNQIEGQWDMIKGKVKQKWGQLTDDHLLEIKGKKDNLVGQIKKTYGIQKEEAENQVEEFKKDLDKANREHLDQESH